jgi:CMP-N,N'-diacetyllegionaminic acid synthase
LKNIAIIPARSGSKGLSNKNIINLAGKPLMYYTINAALDSGCFDEVMVSTDSEEYSRIARECGASVPFMRSEKTSSDTAGSWDMVREVLLNYESLGMQYDYIALLQPTSPLRDSDDIKNVFKCLIEKQAHNVVSVTEVDHPVQWCFRMPENGLMDEFAASPYNYMRRQELDKYYRENGAVYLVDAKMIMNVDYNFYADKCVGYIMPRDKSIDIDTMFDLIVAQAYMDYDKY